MSSTIKWREYLIEQLAKDKEEALGYIQLAFEEYQVDGDTFVFLVALRTFVASQGGIAKLAKQIQFPLVSLERILSSDEAPPLDTFATLLKALGRRLTLEPLSEAAPATETKREHVETRHNSLPKRWDFTAHIATGSYSHPISARRSAGLT